MYLAVAIGYDWWPRVWWCQFDVVGARSVWLWQLDVFDPEVCGMTIG